MKHSCLMLKESPLLKRVGSSNDSEALILAVLSVKLVSPDLLTYFKLLVLV